MFRDLFSELVVQDKASGDPDSSASILAIVLGLIGSLIATVVIVFVAIYILRRSGIFPIVKRKKTMRSGISESIFNSVLFLIIFSHYSKCVVYKR